MGSELRILLATRSTDKVREIREILRDVELVSLAELGVPHDPAEDRVEAFDTFRENACAKARYFADLTGLHTLADDSGICVDALGGQPGVRSRRFAADTGLGGIDLDRANNARLLERLRDVPEQKRTAHYICAAAFVTNGAAEIVALGTVSGRLLDHERGQGGFGYDPLFLLPQLGRTFAEMPGAKLEFSHRSRAFRALAPFLHGAKHSVSTGPRARRAPAGVGAGGRATR